MTTTANTAIEPGPTEARALRAENEHLRARLAAQEDSCRMLAQRQVALQTIISSIPYHVFWKDRQSVYLGCNEAFAKSGGYQSPDQVPGKTDYDMAWTKDEADFFRSCDEKVMSEGVPLLNIEEPLHDADGTQRFILTSKVPLRDESGAVMGILGIYTDITSRRRTELELEHATAEIVRTRDKLIESEKASALGRLLSQLSHEINNPMCAVLCNLDPLHDYLTSLTTMLAAYATLDVCGEFNAKRKEHDIDFVVDDAFACVRSIRAGVERVGDIQRELRRFLRGERLETESVDLNDSLRATVEMLQRGLNPCPLVNASYGVLPFVELNAGQLEQVFLNLLRNATDAVGESGLIAIESHVDGDFVVVTVTDSGPGIAPQQRSKIFEPFFTTKTVGAGSGLGLAVSRQIVTDHGGSLRLEDSGGGGARFVVALPISREEPPRSEERACGLKTRTGD